MFHHHTIFVSVLWQHSYVVWDNLLPLGCDKRAVLCLTVLSVAKIMYYQWQMSAVCVWSSNGMILRGKN